MENRRYTHRGFMLDVSRHYMPVENIKKLLDAAQICGLNRMHWHLADDQGWRIEIKKYPRLTETGSIRGNSYFGNVSETENNCGYYTQEQAREIINYALECGIEIIPEIEVPGHASAMLAAYPQYGCRRTVIKNGREVAIDAPYNYEVINKGGIFPNLICAGRKDAVDFFKDILSEICELFPASAVHIGGDEALKLHWRRCPDCQKRIHDEGLANEEELQRSLILEIGEFLASKGKSTIVYNDCLAGGLLPKHFIVHHWLGNDKETAEFMKSGGRVIRSDLEDFYFDYSYSSIDVEHIRNMPNTPDYAKGCEDGLIGFECMLWTERITNIERAAFLLFPRVAAMALKISGKYTARDNFFAAVKDMQERITALGLEGAPENDWSLSPEAADADRAHDHYLRYSPESSAAEEEEILLLAQEELEKLLADIEMPREFALRVADSAWKALPLYNGAHFSDDGDGADEMAAQLFAALDNREDGPWKNIPERIWLDTLKCYTRFVGEHHFSCGEYGFDRSDWTTRQMNAKLFRIGELEYELTEDDEDGHRIISLHITSNGILKADRLNASVAEAREFIAERFPLWADAPIECWTWLLNPVLKDMLPENSNILCFQTAFDVTPTEDCPNDVLEWVFKLTEKQQEGVDFADLPEDTSLQRKMKAYLLKGGKVYIAHGVMVRKFG